MPWHIEQGHSGCSGWAVVKDSNGKMVPGGCHESQGEAESHLRALYASEDKSMSETDTEIQVNIERTKAAMKRENGIDFPARDFAFVPDPSRPTTWKLRLTESPGKISVSQLGRAAAALSPGGFRGNRVQLPATALSSVKRRIRAEYRKLGVSEEKIPNSVKESNRQDAWTIWKDKAGNYRWMAIYSNNFRDDDDPAEIISDASHRRFVKMVDEGLVDYPEVWLWHVPVAWGKADFVDYVDGFSVATGTVYPDMEFVADFLSKESEMGVSHGMWESTIVRDESDPTVIVEHITHEISPLPRQRAANKLTGFVVIKGEPDMPISEEKKAWLLKAGLDEDTIVNLESTIKSLGSFATDMGLESKEANGDDAEVLDTDPDPPVETDTSEEQETVVAEEVPPGESEDDEDEESVKEKFVTEAVFSDIVGQIVRPFTEAIQGLSAQNKSMQEEIATLRKEVKELSKSDAERLATVKEQTPTLSLESILRGSVIGQDATRVDGRSTLGKDAPVEKQEPDRRNSVGIPILDQLVNLSNQ